jgi:hypothetical protein
MKRESLLFGPFAEALPNFQHVDVAGKPTTRVDFSEPVEGLEAPWGMAQLTFFADRKRVATPTAQHGRPAGLRPRQSGPGHLSAAARFPRHHLHQAAAGRLNPTAPPCTNRSPARGWPAPRRRCGPFWTRCIRICGAPAPVPAELRCDPPDDVRRRIAARVDLQSERGRQRDRRQALGRHRLQFPVRAGTIGNTHFLAIPVNARATDAARRWWPISCCRRGAGPQGRHRHWGDPTVLAHRQAPPRSTGPASAPSPCRARSSSRCPRSRSRMAAGSTRWRKNGCGATADAPAAAGAVNVGRGGAGEQHLAAGRGAPHMQRLPSDMPGAIGAETHFLGLTEPELSHCRFTATALADSL